MTRRPKHPPGLSDSSLLALFRRAVLKRCGYRCVICGNNWELDAHHLVHRGQSKWLRFEVHNGVAVHRHGCHDIANAKGVYAALTDEDRIYLELVRQKTFKQHLSEQGLTESEWRGRVKAALLAELGDG